MGYSMIAREQKEYGKKNTHILLPELNKPVKVKPRDKYRNEHIEVVYGKFVSQTKRLMFLEKQVNNSTYWISYSKEDLKSGIYQYQYL